MKNPTFLIVLLALAVGLSACGKSEEPAEEQAAPETGAVEEPKGMAEQAVESAKEAAESVSQMAESAVEEGAKMAESAMAKGEEMSQAAVAEAEKLIAQARDYIENKETDLAEGVMEQLRNIKESLPASVQEQIDELEAMLSSTGEAEPAPASGQ